MIKKLILSVLALTVVALVAFFAIDGSASKGGESKTFAVSRGSIIDKAVAVGQIEPRKEIEIKSKNGGIVRQIFAEVGDVVKAGDPLFDIAPDPTPLEFAEANRQVELYQVAYDNAAREYKRFEALADKQLVSHQEFEDKKAVYDEAELRLKLSREKLALIESGKTTIADRQVSNIIHAPTAGMVLSRSVEEGDPVVPLTSYQEGTQLMTLAKMDDLIFRGNVDEIDVGKLHEGMGTDIEIGAMPQNQLTGMLARISPKAHQDQGSTLFEVEVQLDELTSKLLRAGYSATASIIINKAEDILLVPERLIHFDDSVATVEVQDTLGVITTREIECGLSDGINMEVIAGLDEGDLVVERPPREITAD
ncbi:MAG TPA: efflux RND transporter periplasmic adaptor subunit [candidate division Zixibacteria bacterium]|nr:efflux RND transporter periplasmic adaptor subunit [candidate division Zixibacteria bacterium]